MAGSLSDFGEKEVLDHVLSSSYSRPANLWLALTTVDPTDAATSASLTEPGSGSYARTACDGASFAAAASRSIATNVTITFPTATGSWGTISHWAIADVASGAGNVLAHGDFTTPKAVISGQTARVLAGELTISLGGALSNYLGNSLLDHLFNETPFSRPGTVAVAFSTSLIDETLTGGTIIEPPLSASYARKVHATWDAAINTSPTLVDNSSAISTVTATSDGWGDVTDSCLCDNATRGAGQVLFFGQLGTPTEVLASDSIQFGTGAMQFTLT